MISKKLKERTYVVKATPLPDRVKDSYQHRRGSNSVLLEDDEEGLEKYDTFFDYEDDLADLKASGEQYAEMLTEDPYIVLEEKESANNSPISMEEAELSSRTNGAIVMYEKQENKTYKDVVGFDFIQCSFEKSDGKRCKRQAPKGHDICSVHKKYKEKHGL